MKIKIKRLILGMKQCELAELVGISKVTMVKIEKGDIANIRFSTLQKIAKVLNSSIEELFL